MSSTAWIKMQLSLRTSAIVDDLADATGLDVPGVLGRLFIVWALGHEHARADGFLRRWTPAKLDRHVGTDGFAEALEAVGWLEVEDGALVLPEWEAHNSDAAKARASAASRKAQQRERDRVSQRGVTAKRDTASRTTVTPPRDQREERREIDKTDSSLRSEPVSPEPAGEPAAPGKPAAIAWTREAGWSGITEADLAAWAEAYPAVDVPLALRQAGEWLASNPAKARRKAWRRFVTNWLGREQDRGGGRASRRDTGGGRQQDGDWDLDALVAAAYAEDGPAKGPDPPRVPPEGIRPTRHPAEARNGVAPPSRPSNGEHG